MIRSFALGVFDAIDAHFNVATAIRSFILGLAAQYALGAGVSDGAMDRTAALKAIAAKWAQLDSPRQPFVCHVATQLPEHDDREQFVAGIDLILAGVETMRDGGITCCFRLRRRACMVPALPVSTKVAPPSATGMPAAIAPMCASPPRLSNKALSRRPVSR